jgi:uncharacterized protein GlcG (DUF336 family)
MAEITLEQARTIIDTALGYGATHGLKPLSVIVLDSGGNCRAFARSDGASPGRFEIARGKAYGAVMLGMPSSKLKERAESEAYFVAAANGAYRGRLIPAAGGVLVRDSNGAVLGAVGITGDTSENDAFAAVAGIEAIGLVADA